MGIGNCTEETITYGVDDPGAFARRPGPDNSDLVADLGLTTAVVVVSLSVAVWGAASSQPLPLVTGSVLALLGAAGVLRGWRRRRQMRRMGPRGTREVMAPMGAMAGTPTCNQTLDAGKTVLEPASFGSGANVKFCQGGTPVATVKINGNQYSVEYDDPNHPVNQGNNPYPQAIELPVVMIDLHKVGGYHEVHLLPEQP